MLQYTVTICAITIYKAGAAMAWENNAAGLNKIFIPKCIPQFLLNCEACARAGMDEIPLIPVASEAFSQDITVQPYDIPGPGAYSC